jgi:hypothetical protein
MYAWTVDGLCDGGPVKTGFLVTGSIVQAGRPKCHRMLLELSSENPISRKANVWRLNASDSERNR